MVLESIVEPSDACRNPHKIALLAAVFVSIGVAGSLLLASEANGLLLIMLVAIPSIPMILKLFEYEECNVEARVRFAGSRTLARHFSVLVVLVAYFLGLCAAFTCWYVVLSPEQTQTIFSTQMNELKAIRASFQGFAVQDQINELAFETIFLHNLQVGVIIVAFSLLYGAGAIFVLVWNASVIGAFLGGIGKSELFHTADAAITNVGMGVLGILPHGIFELLAYSTAALAGGIISQAVIRKAYGKPEFGQILYDTLKLFAWAVVFLAIGALIESTGAKA
ncbi:Stage II sporulation protein M [Candidatus Norongarragalina meridionalis]|nr:Stage II sporulation protein M [Candidatus Norongarragalina meridionalis]